MMHGPINIRFTKICFQTLGFEGINYKIYEWMRDAVDMRAALTAAKNVENI